MTIGTFNPPCTPPNGLRPAPYPSDVTLNVLQQVLDESLSIAFVKDCDGVILFVNRAFCTFLGGTAQDFVGHTDFDFLPRDVAERHRDIDLKVIGGTSAVKFDHVVPVHDGDRHFMSVVIPLLSTDGSVWGIFGVSTDVTEQRRLEAEVIRSHDRLRKFTESTPGMVYQLLRTTDGKFQMPFTSAAIEQTFELTPAQVQSDAAPIFARIHPDDIAAFSASINESAENLLAWHAEFRVLLPRAGERWLLGKSQPERLSDGSTVWYGYAYDITDRKAPADVAWYHSNFDALTDLPNRTLLRDRLDQAIRRARRDGIGLAVLFVDLDGFKTVNQSRGHAVGDAILIEAARRFGRCVRESDTVARYGGDEFVVVVTDTSHECDIDRPVEAIHAQLRRPLRDSPITEPLATASIGVANYPVDGINAEELIAVAAARVHEARRA